MAGKSNIYHERLSTQIIDEVLADPFGDETKQLCRVLNQLLITKKTPIETIKSLKFLVGGISKVCSKIIFFQRFCIKKILID